MTKFHLDEEDPDSAISILDQVLDRSPDCLAAICAAARAHMNASNWDKAGRLYPRIGELSESQAIDDPTQLLLAQEMVIATNNLPGLISNLDALIHRHSHWGIAFALRAQAKSQLVLRTHDFADAESAIADVAEANRLLPESSLVKTQGRLPLYPAGGKAA